MLYAKEMVEPQYLTLFERCCDYACLEEQLEGDEIPGFIYRKRMEASSG